MQPSWWSIADKDESKIRAWSADRSFGRAVVRFMRVASSTDHVSAFPPNKSRNESRKSFIAHKPNGERYRARTRARVAGAAGKWGNLCDRLIQTRCDDRWLSQPARRGAMTRK